MDTWIWAVIVGLLVVALAALVLLALWLGKRQSETAAHEEAESIRTDVRERASDFGERTAAVREREAEAQHVRAKADRLRAEAESIEQDAHQRRTEVDAEREDYRDALHRADEMEQHGRQTGK